MRSSPRSFSRPHRAAGFTLLELMVVGTVGIIVLMIISNTWRWYLRGTRDTQVVVQLTKELKMAADAMAGDYGPAIAARTTDGTSVEFNYDGGGTPDGSPQWGDPDTVVEYLVQSQKLVRRDVTSGAELPLADHIKSLDAQVVAGKLQVKLTAEFETEQHDLTLQFEE
jgi:type II secretory pathway pseudopilin PulG